MAWGIIIMIIVSPVGEVALEKTITVWDALRTLLILAGIGYILIETFLMLKKEIIIMENRHD